MSCSRRYPRQRRARSAQRSSHQAPPAQADDVRHARLQQTETENVQKMLDTMQDIRASPRQSQRLDQIFEVYLGPDTADRGRNLVYNLFVYYVQTS